MLESVEIGGMKRTGDEFPERFRVDQTFDFTLSVNNDANPKRLDIHEVTKDGTKVTRKSIYKIEDTHFVQRARRPRSGNAGVSPAFLQLLKLRLTEHQVDQCEARSVR